MRRAVFWPLLLLVSPQALWMRRYARASPEAEGPREGECGVGPPFRLLGLGDSIIAGTGAPTIADALVGQTAAALAASRGCRVCWTAVGRSGFTSERARHELLPLLPEDEQDAMIVSLGVNDVTRARRSEAWRRDLGFVLDALHAHSPRAVIGVCGVPPLNHFPRVPQPLRFVLGLRSRTFDSITHEVTGGRPWSVYVPMPSRPVPTDFASDGYHPAPPTYRALGATAARTIAAALAPRER